MEDKNLKDDQILERLWREAQRIEPPRDLAPEELQKRLAQQPRKQGKLKTKHFHWHGVGTRVTAAGLVLAVSLSVFALAGRQQIDVAVDDSSADGSLSNDSVEQSVDAVSSSDVPDTDAQPAASEPELVSAKVLGTFHQAESYAEIADLLTALREENKQYAYAEDLADGAVAWESAASSVEDSAASSGSVDFSTTNLQVQGVDESDIVKTDWRYIYIAAEDCVRIVDTAGGQVRQLGSIIPEFSGNLDRICEMYLTEERLSLIIQAERTGNLKTSDAEGAEDVAYNFTGESCTQVLTYDVSAPEKAKLIGTYEQDGSYKTSRKIGEQLYLFTDYWLENQTAYVDGTCFINQSDKETSYSSYDADAFVEQTDTNIQEKQDADEETLFADVDIEAACAALPRAQGTIVPQDCIYLSEKTSGNNLGAVYITSLAVSAPEQVCDQKLIFHGGASLYVTAETMLLYRSQYRTATNGYYTNLTKFIISDGKIIADCAEAVDGRIEDTFAIHETAADNLYVLTTNDAESGVTNQLFVLDENLKIKGKLTHIADGERVYAARFMDEIGYFVTYRNTDPLFTVDFSEPEQPTVIGELELPGFSDYLQFWGSDYLIGVGEERTAEESEFIGVKLSLYDISNPTDVKECAKMVLEDAYDSPAANNYKALLADRKRNVIAFLTNDKSENNHMTEHIFTVDDGVLNEQIADVIYDSESWDRFAGNYRNLYIGKFLYLVYRDEIIVYDMTDGFARVGTYELH